MGKKLCALNIALSVIGYNNLFSMEDYCDEKNYYDDENAVISSEYSIYEGESNYKNMNKIEESYVHTKNYLTNNTSENCIKLKYSLKNSGKNSEKYEV